MQVPTRRIIIGSVVGQHFHGNADLEVVHYCLRGSDRGYYHVRKRLVDREAFNYDPRLGWEVDRWFEWDDDDA